MGPAGVTGSDDNAGQGALTGVVLPYRVSTAI
jgi:hypothetical protein